MTESPFKIIISCVILLVFCLSFISALDCQYTQNKPYSKEVVSFYENGSKLNYPLLEVKDISQGNPGSPYWGGASPMQFKVYNNYNSEINVTISYIFNGQLQTTPEVVIASSGYYVVSGPTSPGLDENTINFNISTPGLSAIRELTNLNNITCRKCLEGSNITCINDGQNCTDSSQCGGSHCIRGICSNSSSCFNNDCNCSSDEVQCSDNTQCAKKNSVQLGYKPLCKIDECITGYINKNGACALKNGSSCLISDDCASGNCNPAKQCGEFTGCPNGGKLCNNQSCLIAQSKNNSELYQCDWECTNGTIACNGTCRAVSSRNSGQEYHCIQECKSGRGKDGVCLKSVEWWVYFWVICIIIASGGVWYLAVHKRKKEDEEREKAEKELKKINAEKEKLLEDTKKLNKELEEGKTTIKKLEGDIKNSEGRAKEEFEKKLAQEEERQKTRTQKINDKSVELEKNSKELEKNDEKVWREKALQDSGQRNNLDFNREGYLIFKDNPSSFFHVWKYKDYMKKRGERIPENVSIHHIDRNKYNNALWNLIPIDKKVHDISPGEDLNGKFNHNLIEGDTRCEKWESGIQQLKSQLEYGTPAKPFPEHIQKEIRKRKEQEKLNIIN